MGRGARNPARAKARALVWCPRDFVSNESVEPRRYLDVDSETSIEMILRKEPTGRDSSTGWNFADGRRYPSQRQHARATAVNGSTETERQRQLHHYLLRCLNRFSKKTREKRAFLPK
jgi:hypothetical protein